MTEQCKVCKYFRPTDKYCYYYEYDVQYREDCKFEKDNLSLTEKENKMW